MLDSKFPRILGDIGNRDTWSFPVIYGVVDDALPGEMIAEQSEQFLEAFILKGLELVEQGAVGITTSCGFLSVYQNELAKALPVPVMTSSLFQVPMINRALPEGKRCGVLTISATSLNARHLLAAGAPEDTPVGSTEEGGEFNRVILGNLTELNVERAEDDNVAAASKLKQTHPNIGAIVLECTNMAPYAEAIAAATGLPVYSIVDLIDWFYSGLNR